MISLRQKTSSTNVGGTLRFNAGTAISRKRAIHCRANVSSSNGVQNFAFEDRFISRLMSSCLVAERTDFPDLLNRSLEQLSTSKMPTNKQENFRFTDLSPILQSNLKPSFEDRISNTAVLDEAQLDYPGRNRVVFLDGRIQWKLTSLTEEWKAVVSDAASNPHLSEKLGLQSSKHGGIFAALNGALFLETLAILIPGDVHLESPLHLLYLTAGSKDGVRVSAPRIYIQCGVNSKAEIVEEFMSLKADSSSHLSIPVCEIGLQERAELDHHYVQLDGKDAMHMKMTFIEQSSKSCYRLVESNIGGLLSRHDLFISQSGQETETEMCHFQLSSDTQMHDLHSRVTLDHEEGTVNQLHKCIVASASGSGIFDGNVQVNKFAQRTDAGQLSRSLLLVPKAMVNIKPNLQIIADDVKCTHGCTVSDLSAAEVFYFRARGIDQETARQALVFSFGSEINQKLKSEALRERVESAVLKQLQIM